MLDALMPALDAGRAAADGGADVAAVTAAMADAAEAGAAATIPLLATKGRASYLGERSIGHQDPGATSSALLLRALADVVAGADRITGARPRGDPRRCLTGPRRLEPGVGVGRSCCGSRPVARGSPARAATPRPSAGDPGATRPSASAPRSRRPPTELTALAAQTTARAGEEVGAIFEAQALFARDPGIVDPTLAAHRGRARRPTRRSSTSTEQQAADAGRGRRRVLPGARRRRPRRRAAGRGDRSAGEPRPDLWHADGRPGRPRRRATSIRPPSPALRRELVAGIALAGGAPTGHAAIVARALGIPLVLGLGAAIGDARRRHAEVAVDGTAAGSSSSSPTRRRSLASAPRGRRRRAADRSGTIDVVDRHGIAVVANVASPVEAEAAVARRRRRDRAGPHGARCSWDAPRRRRSPSSGRPTRASARRWRIGRSSSGRSTSVATSRRPGGDGRRPRRTRRSASAVSDSAQRARSCSTTSSGRSSRPADGGVLRVMLPMVSTREEVEAVRARLDRDRGLARWPAAGRHPGRSRSA